jgi:hypothetical protein
MGSEHERLVLADDHDAGDPDGGPVLGGPTMTRTAFAAALVAMAPVLGGLGWVMAHTIWPLLICVGGAWLVGFVISDGDWDRGEE